MESLLYLLEATQDPLLGPCRDILLRGFLTFRFALSLRRELQKDLTQPSNGSTGRVELFPADNI